MRAFLTSIFLLITFFCFSQTGKDTLSHTPSIKSSHDTLTFADTVKNKIQSDISRSLIKQEHSIGKELSAPISSLTDTTSKKKSPLSIKSPLSNISGDTAKLKSLVPKIDIRNKASSTRSLLTDKKDSLFSKSSAQIKAIKPKSVSFLKKQFNAMRPHGNISAGYEYGVLPFVAGGNYPAQGFKTEGRISFLVLSVPLELNYYYTNIKNTIGLNNYFRISYDPSRYKDQLANKLNVKNQLNTEKLGKLQLQQQGIMQKMEYLNFLKQNPNYKIPAVDSSKNKLPGTITSLAIKDPLVPFSDSLSKSLQKDTSGLLKHSVKTNSPDNMHKEDSISHEYSAYKSKYDSINKEINLVKKEIDEIKNLQKNASTLANPYFSKIQSFLSGVQKFEIGLCHPTYSTFLVNNIPLKGINFEYAKNSKFLAFTYGTTINNLLYNPNTIQGTLQGTRNLYNYFDFGNLAAGRKIISLKGGFGEKEGSHLYVGFLLGKGRSDYLMLTPVDAASTSYSKESNVVMELDAKYKFSEQLSVDAVYGKSSIKEEDLTMDQIRRSVTEIFSNYRSNAFLGRMNASIKKTKTKITVTTRWVDPYFKSFGIGFMRSDNFRYEIKAEQVITSKIKYTIAYRKEEDNLLKLYDYKNTLQSINNSLNLKINRQLNVRLIYTPLFRELTTPSVVIKDRNTISTVVLSYTPRPKKVTAQFNLLFSKYIISSDSNNINFENLTYTHQFLFKTGFKTDLNVSWFKNNLKDTLGNDTYLAVLGVGYVAKNMSSFTLGGKMAYKSSIEPQYGFVVKINVKLYKGLFWEAQVEKIIIGDYYNSFMIEKIKQFPYYSNTRLVFNF